MKLNRRNVLVGLGTIVAGGGAALGTGAFSQVEADRSASIAVADDDEAFLGLEIHEDRLDDGTPDSPYVEYDDSNSHEIIEFYFDGDENNDNDGLNVNAVTRFDNLITITNDSTNDVSVEIKVFDDDDSEVDLGFNAYVGEEEDNDLEKIDSEESKDVGFEFDLTDNDAEPDEADEAENFLIRATDEERED